MADKHQLELSCGAMANPKTGLYNFVDTRSIADKCRPTLKCSWPGRWALYPATLRTSSPECRGACWKFKGASRQSIQKFTSGTHSWGSGALQASRPEGPANSVRQFAHLDCHCSGLTVDPSAAQAEPRQAFRVVNARAVARTVAGAAEGKLLANARRRRRCRRPTSAGERQHRRQRRQFAETNLSPGGSGRGTAGGKARGAQERARTGQGGRPSRESWVGISPSRRCLCRRY